MKKGHDAEDFTADFLRKKGYEIVEQNYFCRFGEIDIIAKNKKYIVFVEVKMRGENFLDSAEAAVTVQKQKKIIKAAECFLSIPGNKLQPRFDIAAVYGKNGYFNRVKYYENAFSAQGVYL